MAVLGETRLPVIMIHDLRHTHASLVLPAGEPVKTVRERHVMPGDQKRAASGSPR